VTPAETTPDKRRALVLVVDDEEAMLEVYVDTLQRLSVDVIAERDPRRAADAFRHDGHYDLVVLDLRMPHIDGLSLLRLLREAHPQVPVMVVTGYPSTESAAVCRGLGVTDYVRKPFDPDDLLRRVRRVLTPAPGPGAPAPDATKA
jgi:DNA-binding response OmpR family regulator